MYACSCLSFELLVRKRPNPGKVPARCKANAHALDEARRLEKKQEPVLEALAPSSVDHPDSFIVIGVYRSLEGDLWAPGEFERLLKGTAPKAVESHLSVMTQAPVLPEPGQNAPRWVLPYGAENEA